DADGADRRNGSGGGLACGRIHASRGGARAEGSAPPSRSSPALPAGTLLCGIRSARVHRRGIVLALDLGDPRSRGLLPPLRLTRIAGASSAGPRLPAVPRCPP